MALRKRTDAYWQKRAVQRVDKSEQTSAKYMRQLRKIYADARRQTVKELQKIYAAYYSKDEGFDMQALRSIVPRGELKAFLNEMKRLGLKTGLPDNYNTRVTRLRLINEQLAAEAHKLAPQEQNIDTEAFKQVYTDSYYRAGFDVAQGIGSTPVGFTGLDYQTLDQVLNARFEGKNFSSRIWTNTDILANKLKGELAVAIANGQGIQKTAREFRNRYDTNQYYAERLIRTETNHFHNEGELEAYKQMGFEYFQFLATLDNRTSEICAEMDGKKFKVSEGIPGDNVPPLHPNCRSTIVPYFKEYEPETRLYRNPRTGKNEYTYHQSYERWREDWAEELSATGRRTDWSLIDKTARVAEKEIRGKKYETLLVLDEKDRVVHAEKGGQHRVSLSNKARHLLAKDGYAASHNHPSGSSFSAADLKTASSLNLRYIRAVSKDMTFEVKAKNEWPSIANIDRVHSRNLEKARKKAMEWQIKTGSAPTDLLWGKFTHESMAKTASELNLIYKSSIIKKRK